MSTVRLRWLQSDYQRLRDYVTRHLVEISLPRDYPRVPPLCRMLTPVFHPNIAPHAICIGDHWSAGENRRPPLAACAAPAARPFSKPRLCNDAKHLSGSPGRWQASLHMRSLGWLMALCIAGQIPYRIACLLADRPVVGLRFPWLIGRESLFLLIVNWIVGFWL